MAARRGRCGNRCRGRRRRMGCVLACADGSVRQGHSHAASYCPPGRIFERRSHAHAANAQGANRRDCRRIASGGSRSGFQRFRGQGRRPASSAVQPEIAPSRAASGCEEGRRWAGCNRGSTRRASGKVEWFNSSFNNMLGTPSFVRTWHKGWEGMNFCKGRHARAPSAVLQ